MYNRLITYYTYSFLIFLVWNALKIAFEYIPTHRIILIIKIWF